MKCEACDLEAGHEGPHEVIVPFAEVSEGWTGSPEQWEAWNAAVAAGTAVVTRVVELPRRV